MTLLSVVALRMCNLHPAIPAGAFRQPVEDFWLVITTGSVPPRTAPAKTIAFPAILIIFRKNRIERVNPVHKQTPLPGWHRPVLKNIADNRLSKRHGVA
jgi:hypothetical protein